MWKWYVYELSDSDGVFYVGKGSGDRIRTTRLCGNQAKISRAASCCANIVAYFKHEEDALSHEVDRISWYTGLTNVTHNERDFSAIQKQLDEDWSRLYKSVIFMGDMKDEYTQIHKAVCDGYEKISKDIRCRAGVNVRARADLLAHLIKKLPRCKEPLPNGGLLPLIISYLSFGTQGKTSNPGLTRQKPLHHMFTLDLQL